jgi:ABC-type tungstate transport system substrate-binding protein
MTALIGLAFGVGYALVNFGRRVPPLSIAEILFGGVFGIADNADTAVAMTTRQKIAYAIGAIGVVLMLPG